MTGTSTSVAERLSRLLGTELSWQRVLRTDELNVIHAVCIWCVASATCALFHVVVNSTRYVRGEPVLA